MSALRAGIDRAVRGSGATEVPVRAHAFTALLVVLAVVATISGLLWPAFLREGDPLPPAARFGIACGLMALAQLASLRLRIGSGRLSVTWGEAGLIIGLYAAPSGWLPAATFAGTFAAWLLMSVFAKLRTPLEVVFIAASQTVAVAGAVTVACLLSDPIGAPLTPRRGTHPRPTVGGRPVAARQHQRPLDRPVLCELHRQRHAQHRAARQR